MSSGYSYGFMSKNGLYLRVSVNGYAIEEVTNSTGTVHSWVLPLREDTFNTPTDRQQFFQPIDELFKSVSDVISSMGSTFVSGTADLIVKYQDIFGTRLFNSNMFAQAWRHAMPSEMSLKLDFNFGMLNQWNGQTEVLQPLLILKRATLPVVGTGGAYWAPGPTGASVYAAFGKNIFDVTIGAAVDAIKRAAQQTSSYATGAEQGQASMAVDKAMSGVTSGVKGAMALADAATSKEKAASTYRGIWIVELIAYANNQTKTLFVSPEMICSESTISFGNQLDDTLSPISGSCNLTLSSQKPTTSDAYKLDSAWR